MRSIPCLVILALAAGPSHLLAEDHGHDHAAGEAHDHGAHGEAEKAPHGGVLKEVGDDHLELVHDPATGNLTLHVLDGKLQPHAIAAKPLSIQAKPAGGAALIPVTLDPATPDQASEFRGANDALKGAAAVDVILRIEIDGKNQRVVFSTAKAADEGHHEGDGHKH